MYDFHKEPNVSVATVGARYQVVIPSTERKQLELKPNQKVNVSVEEGRIIIEPLGSYKIRGLMREIRDGSDPVEYIRRLRKEWESRS